MKKKITLRLTGLLLVAALLGSMGVSFASGIIDPHGYTGVIGAEEYTGPTGEPIIEFQPGEVYELIEQPGTTKNKDGFVEAPINDGHIIEAHIPVVRPEDEYYELRKWKLIHDNGDTVEIENLTEYLFRGNRKFKVAPVIEDTWPPYLDMKQDRTDWFYRYVRDLSIAGVVNGYPGYIFEPQGDTTWGEALKLIMRAVGYPVQTPTDAHWASGYLTKARADALVPEGEIDLNQPITRLEYAQVTAKALKLEPVILNPETEEGEEPAELKESPFTDTEDPYVLALQEAGIVEGYPDGSFRPSEKITRAEISTVIWRVYKYNKAHS